MNIYNCGICGKIKRILKNDGKLVSYACYCNNNTNKNLAFCNLEGIKVLKLDLSHTYQDLIKVIKQ